MCKEKVFKEIFMKKTLVLLWSVFFTTIAIFAQEEKEEVDLQKWKLIDQHIYEPYEFDTVINYFQIYNPVDKWSISSSWLGNLGSPWKSNIFHNQYNDLYSDFIFDQFYKPYVFSVEEQPFFHAKKPYVELYWSTSNRKRNENQLAATFTQNITKKWNMGFRYKLIASDGEFPNSLVSSHSMNLFTSYKGEKYSIHAGFIRNKIKNEESGGLNLKIFEEDGENVDFAAPILDESSSGYYKRTLFVSQEYKFGFTKKIVINDSTTESSFIELGRFNHVINYDKNYRIFYNGDPLNPNFENAYISNVLTKDSLSLNKLENSLYWTFKEIKKQNFNGRLTTGITMENLKWDNSCANAVIDSVKHSAEDAKFPNRNIVVWNMADFSYYQTMYNNFKLSANLDARTKMFVFNVNGFYYINAGLGESNKVRVDELNNFEGNLLLSKSFMIAAKKSDFYLKYKIAKRSPTIFENRYVSNHINWGWDENDDGGEGFGDQFINEVRVGLKIPAIRLKAEFANSTISNYLYFNSEGKPAQLSDDNIVNVTSISVNKDIKLGRFHFINKVVYQFSPNRITSRLDDDDLHVLSIPELALYHSGYYNFNQNFKKTSAEAQFGYDIRYTTEYRTMGYNPIVGQFVPSNIRYKSSIRYPVINVFVNVRIKTVLLFLKYEHLNYRINSSKNKLDYILDLHPMNTNAVRFGAAWRFRN